MLSARVESLADRSVAWCSESETYGDVGREPHELRQVCQGRTEEALGGRDHDEDQEAGPHGVHDHGCASPHART